MSGSETGGGALVVGGGELRQQSPVAAVQTQLPPAALQNMHLSFTPDGISVYKPPNGNHSYNDNNNNNAAAFGGRGGEVSAAGGTVAPHGINVNMGIGSEAEPVKRKRGRPRKYGPDGTIAAALAAHSLSFAQSSGGGGEGGARPLSPSSGASVSPTSIKKAKGRPPGSTKKQRIEALGSACVGFTPHVIIVKSGEDVCSKIMSISQHGSRVVCILTANGSISNVTLRQPATSGGTVAYEGRFEILSLSGSFMLCGDADQRTRTGVLSVSLSGPDGWVLGGSVAGLLTAASPVQVVLGSFIADGHNESKSANRKGHLSPAVRLPALGGQIGACSPPSRAMLSESSGGPGSPPN